MMYITCLRASLRRNFITEVYVSLDNLVTEDFAPSLAEIRYFAECFEGKRTFSREEVREFEIGSLRNRTRGREREKRSEINGQLLIINRRGRRNTALITVLIYF
jgi:hypothetical protein